MKDMLKFLVARDTMHQNQWLAAWQELGGPKNHPIPNNFPQDQELQEVSYEFFYTGIPVTPQVPNPASQGPSFDGRGEFKPVDWKPRGGVPNLGMASPKASAQARADRGPSESEVVGDRSRGRPCPRRS